MARPELFDANADLINKNKIYIYISEVAQAKLTCVS